MIVSFSCHHTKAAYQGKPTRKFPHEIRKRAIVKLDQIHAANLITDLRLPPSNHLKKLSGDRSEFYSIRINDQWRITFLWENEAAHQVKIEDYH